MKLSIIIVSWNVKDKIRENLKAIFASIVDFGYEVIVVDNNSSDGSKEMIAEEFPQVKLICNDDNLGFAKANNQAIKLVNSEYVLLLNPDMKPEPDTFGKMASWLFANDQVWVAGCRLLSPDNELISNVRQFPGLWDQLLIVLKIPHILPFVLDAYLRKDFDYDKASKVDSVRGGFFMLNMKNFRQLPLLDERYFLWFEEVDFCRQVKQSGGEVWYTPEAKCVDLVGQSFAQVKRFRTQRYFRDSMLKYFLKWHGLAPYLVLYVAWIPMIAMAWVLDLFRIKGNAKT